MSKKAKLGVQFEFGMAAETFNLAYETVNVPVCRKCGRGMVGMTCGCEDERRKADQAVMLWLDGQEGAQA